MSTQAVEQQAEGALVPVTFSQEDRVKIAELRELLRQEQTLLPWKIGDLILDICGPSGTPETDGRLAKLAGELDISLNKAARYRVTSEVFPPEQRNWDLPWSAYEWVQKDAALSEEILDRVLEETGKAAFSRSLVSRVRDEVRRENGMGDRLPPRLSQPEKLARGIYLFRERFFKHNFSISYSEALEILREWNEFAPVLYEIARQKQ